jgi:hypothetical protein
VGQVHITIITIVFLCQRSAPLHPFERLARTGMTAEGGGAGKGRTPSRGLAFAFSARTRFEHTYRFVLISDIAPTLAFGIQN